MRHEFYYLNEDNEPTKVLIYDDVYSVDDILDIINSSKWTIIDKHKFELLTIDLVLMTVDIKDPETEDIKIGELTFEKMDLNNVEFIK